MSPQLILESYIPQGWGVTLIPDSDIPQVCVRVSSCAAARDFFVTITVVTSTPALSLTPFLPRPPFQPFPLSSPSFPLDLLYPPHPFIPPGPFPPFLSPPPLSLCSLPLSHSSLVRLWQVQHARGDTAPKRRRTVGTRCASSEEHRRCFGLWCHLLTNPQPPSRGFTGLQTYPSHQCDSSAARRLAGPAAEVSFPPAGGQDGQVGTGTGSSELGEMGGGGKWGG